MNKKKKEEFDINTLPKVNIATSSLLVTFKTPERKYKVFENLFRNPDKVSRFITRDQIIEFAKENKIYIDPEDGKRPGPKDPPIEKREITPDELAKAASGIITDRSIQFRKDKKALMEKIEEMKKQKEDAIAYWANPPPVDPKKKTDKKKVEPPNPNDIIIPVIDDYDTEMLVIFYNYPLNPKEYYAMEKENLILNNIHYVKDTDESLEEVKVEVVQDKNTKKPPVKENKPTNKEIEQMTKYFTVPNVYANSEEVFQALEKSKFRSDKLSQARMTLLDRSEFWYKYNDETKKDSYVTFQEEYISRMKVIYKNYLLYIQWLACLNYQKLVDNESGVKVYTPSSIKTLIEEAEVGIKDFEHASIGVLLFIFCVDLIKKLRNEGVIKEDAVGVNIPQSTIDTDTDGIFEDFEKKISVQLGKVDKPHISQPTETEVAPNSDTHPQSDVDIDHNQDTSQALPNQNQTENNPNPNQEEVSPSSLSNNNEKKDNIIEPINDTLMPLWKLLIDENDYIAKHSLENKLDNQYISAKEKSLNTFRCFPGLVRPGNICPIEENRRKAIRSEIYPFLPDDMGIPIYEKFEVISKFEEMMRKEFPERGFDLGDRVYQENLNTDLLSQTINRILLFEPEYRAVYNERCDNMFLVFFYKCPQGRVYRKTKRYHYLSKPDFDNWVKLFRPTIKDPSMKTTESIPNVITEENKNVNPPVKEESRVNFNLNVNANINRSGSIVTPAPLQKMLTRRHSTVHSRILTYDPDTQILYEADDTYTGEVREKIKYMFPSDNGIFIKKVIEYGIFSAFSSYVIKDHLLFGIRQNESKVPEFWCRFENDYILTVNYIGDYNSSAPLNDNHSKYDSKNGAYVNISCLNGLNVQILPSGEICQKILHEKDCTGSTTNEESHRIVTSKASVLRYFPNETQILYANGNFCSISPEGIATNVNNKGFRIARNLHNNSVTEKSSIPITIQTDTESLTKTIIREDKVVVIKYPDNSTLAIHSDETKIFTYPPDIDINRYTIEHDLYATTEIIYDASKINSRTILNPGSADALVGSEGLLSRAYDGRLSKVTLPDKTIVYVFKEKKEIENNSDMCVLNTVSIIFRQDGTVIRIQQDGDCCIITSQERMNINSRNPEGVVKDSEYLLSLNATPEERSGGVYSVDLKKSKIFTIDHEKNIFELYSDGIAKCKLQSSTDENITNTKFFCPDSPRYEGDDYIDPDAFFREPPSNFYTPRLFVIENDNSGYELLSESQVSNFKLSKVKDTLHTKYFNQSFEKFFNSHYWITKFLFTQELIQETHVINDIKIPRCLEKITQTPTGVLYPDNEIFLYRNLIESPPFSQEFRQKIAASMEAKKAWYEKKSSGWLFGTLNKNLHVNEIQSCNEVRRRVLQERQTKDVEYHYATLQNLLEMKEVMIKIIPNSSVLFDIEDFIQLKESQKIIEDRGFRIYPLHSKNIPLSEVNRVLAEADVSNESSPGIQKRKTAVIEIKSKEIKFCDNYFQSEKGSLFATKNPRGNDYIKKDNTKDKEEELAQMLIKSHRENPQTDNGGNEDEKNINDNIPNNFERNSPIVYLEDDKKGGKVETKQEKKKKLLPSMYQRSKEFQAVQADIIAKEAEHWHDLKTIKYSHDGSERKINPNVPPYLKTTFPQAEFNEDYLYIEKMTDRRIKTSSVANRLYFNAPSVNEIRKSGQHDFIMEALNNKRTYDEMMERLNLMITAELCDPLNKVLKIDPVELDFGFLEAGKSYQMFFKIRNDDNMINRIQLRKNIDCSNLKIECFIGGKIVPGDTKKIKIVVDTRGLFGKFSEIINIQTKSFIYKIPIKALVIPHEEYDEKKYFKEGREPYKHEYPPGEKKLTYDPIKLVLPKLKKAEQQILALKKQNEKTNSENNSLNESQDEITKFPRVEEKR